MIRYYGIYGRHRKSDSRLRRAISKKHSFFLSTHDVILYFKHTPVPLHQLYGKDMQKQRCRSPVSVTYLSQSLLS